MWQETVNTCRTQKNLVPHHSATSRAISPTCAAGVGSAVDVVSLLLAEPCLFFFFCGILAACSSKDVPTITPYVFRVYSCLTLQLALPLPTRKNHCYGLFMIFLIACRGMQTVHELKAVRIGNASSFAHARNLHHAYACVRTYVAYCHRIARSSVRMYRMVPQK